MRIFLRLIGYVVLLLFFFCVIFIIQQYFNISIMPWEILLGGILTLLAVFASILQYQLLNDAVGEAIKHFSGVIKNLGFWIWPCIKKLGLWIWTWPKGQKVVWGIVAIIVIVLMLGRSFGFYRVTGPSITFPWRYHTPTPTPSIVAQTQTCDNEQKRGIKGGIGVLRKGVDCIGISDGNAIFDLNHDLEFRSNLSSSMDALSKDPLSAKAQAALYGATLRDPANAEPRIYYEDSFVQSDSHPHVTLIVATILTGRYGYDSGCGCL